MSYAYSYVILYIEKGPYVLQILCMTYVLELEAIGKNTTLISIEEKILLYPKYQKLCPPEVEEIYPVHIFVEFSIIDYHTILVSLLKISSLKMLTLQKQF